MTLASTVLHHAVLKMIDDLNRDVNCEKSFGQPRDLVPYSLPSVDHLKTSTELLINLMRAVHLSGISAMVLFGSELCNASENELILKRNIIIATHPSLSTHHKLVTFNWLLHYPLKTVVTGLPYNTAYHTSLTTMILLLYSLPVLIMLILWLLNWMHSVNASL
ncbi:uncharacterized protein [Dysidea avara]|uniref:uncharacterized protein isoform X1 n=1 Tax=Dysidea avara TaxID=196820 RepID=UPI00332C385B